MSPAFRDRYGRVAVVAGASEGLGAAFATELARRGLDLVLVARRAALLEELASSLAREHGVRVTPLATDLAAPSFPEALADATRGLEVGLGVYNAAATSIGPMLDRPLEEALRIVEVNCAGPVRFAHALAPAMVARGRGGLVLLSSVAGFQGGPRIAAYAASKAFARVLAEGLWGELGPRGVDVLASCPGATRTPNYLRSAKKDAPGTLDADVVATRTLDALGRGPTTVPGAVNTLATWVLGRVLPRSAAVSIMSRSTGDLT